MGWAVVPHVVKQRTSPKYREINKVDGNIRFHHRAPSDRKVELFT